MNAKFLASQNLRILTTAISNFPMLQYLWNTWNAVYSLNKIRKTAKSVCIQTRARHHTQLSYVCLSIIIHFRCFRGFIVIWFVIATSSSAADAADCWCCMKTNTTCILEFANAIAMSKRYLCNTCGTKCRINPAKLTLTLLSLLILSMGYIQFGFDWFDLIL